MSDRAPLLRLLSYTRGHRRAIAWASTFSVLNKLFDLAPPALIGMAVDVVVQQEASLLARWGVVEPLSQLWVLAGLTLAIWGLESVFEYAYGVVWRNLAQTIQHELRNDAWDHLQRLPMAWFQDRSTGGLMAVVNDDVNQLERFLDGGANEVIQVATTVVAVGIAFTALSPGVTAFAFLPVPVVVVGSFVFQRRIAPRYAVVRERVSALNGQLANNLGGIATIKATTTEDFERARIARLSDEYRDANRAAIRLSAAFSPLIRMAIVLGFTGTLVLGGMQALEGTLAVGTYSVLVFLTQRLLWPLTRLGATFDLYQRAMASTARILDLLDTPIDQRLGDRPLAKVRGELRFEGVSFSYPDRSPVLTDFDLRVPAGATVAIVGPTGAGKSTVVQLLLRFYDPQEGRILIDGVDHQEVRIGDLRRAIGLVSQGVFLFSGSVRDNIAYGSPEATDAAIEAAARLAEAHDFITALPQGYATRVGERGVKLSGGQQQRISIARALLRDPPILVLDEATSAVDNETEVAIQRSLARVTANRTTLLIAHRLSTVRHADEILVLEAGRIVERGTHEDLLARRDSYHRLWRVQTGEVTR